MINSGAGHLLNKIANMLAHFFYSKLIWGNRGQQNFKSMSFLEKLSWKTGVGLKWKIFWHRLRNLSFCQRFKWLFQVIKFFVKYSCHFFLPHCYRVINLKWQILLSFFSVMLMRKDLKQFFSERNIPAIFCIKIS